MFARLFQIRGAICTKLRCGKQFSFEELPLLIGLPSVTSRRVCSVNVNHVFSVAQIVNYRVHESVYGENKNVIIDMGKDLRKRNVLSR